MLLREGDTVHIAFPGSPTFDTTELIRVDGKIMMPLIGEVVAAGKTPLELQDDLAKAYEPQLTTKQVVVTVQSSSFPVYVTGAVVQPGKVTADHPISALEAIMLAGGFDDSKANLKAVVVIRQSKDGSATFYSELGKGHAGRPGKAVLPEAFRHRAGAGKIHLVLGRVTWAGADPARECDCQELDCGSSQLKDVNYLGNDPAMRLPAC